jgi:hypothetical protein
MANTVDRKDTERKPLINYDYVEQRDEAYWITSTRVSLDSVVNHILETCPIVKRKDEQAYSDYRTKRVILDIYDAMQQVMETGTAYSTRLDPPAAHGWAPQDVMPQAVVEQ